jgi:undecaprenyl diphosphate synthase
MISDSPLEQDTRAAALLADIDRTRLPAHIAIIMDGNGRWAKERSLERVEGHRIGIESVRAIVTTCRELGVKVVTLYAFSTENWKRSEEEVTALMHLLDDFLKVELQTMMENEIRFTVTGRVNELPQFVQKTIAGAMKQTAGNQNTVLNLALNYGGRGEIVDATRKIANLVRQGEIKPEEIDEGLFSNFLYNPAIPDPDLLIRTSGEMRVSNFLLWEIAYSEIWITDILWPDFRREALFTAILDYQRRERRFGSAE